MQKYSKLSAAQHIRVLEYFRAENKNLTLVSFPFQYLLLLCLDITGIPLAETFHTDTLHMRYMGFLRMVFTIKETIHRIILSISI